MALVVSVDEWDSPTFNFWDFDRRVDELAQAGPLVVTVEGTAERRDDVRREVAIRCQRWTRRSVAPELDKVLACHRALHDLTKPLVIADWAHTLDTWQWTLRLAPEASLAVQLAALFHDIERLTSEADFRVEHHAADYQGFKDGHAASGAELAGRILSEAGVDPANCQRTTWLIARHESSQKAGDTDLALLSDADALSFFSLNSPGYLAYFGPEQTRRKVAWTLGRLRPAARRYLAEMRLPSEVAEEIAA